MKQPIKLIDILKETVMSEKIQKKNIGKYVTVEIEDGDEFPILNKKAVAEYLKSVIDPKYLRDVNIFMRDEEGFEESSTYFFDDAELADNENADYSKITDQEVEDWVKQEMSHWLFSKPDEFPSK